VEERLQNIEPVGDQARAIGCYHLNTLNIGGVYHHHMALQLAFSISLALRAPAVVK
jgi:hypothetical protein